MRKCKHALQAVMLLGRLLSISWITAGILVVCAEGQNNVCDEETLTAPSGNITSPNYPSTYGNSLDCTAHIETTSDKIIALTFLDIDMQNNAKCIYDELKIYDGTTLYTGKSFCGQTLPRNFEAHNATVTITFTTDNNHGGRGFYIQWTTKARCADTEFSCWNGDCIPLEQHCDQTRHCSDDSDEIECDQASSSFGECGKVSVAPQFLWNTRIVGGNTATQGSWPWQVRLSIVIGTSTFLCGGSVIDEEWVLSAAHCFEDATASGITVHAGYHSATVTEGVQSVSVSQIINHPDYNKDTLANDITLLKLATRLTYTATVRPICIPEDTETYNIPTGTTCVATGFGALAHQHDLASELQQVRLPIVDQSVCATRYSNLLDSMICAGDYDKGGVDSCQGDSGGPLVCFVSEEKWFQVGVTSFGRECAQSNNPGVYSRVSKFATWIYANGPATTSTTTTSTTTTTTTTSTTPTNTPTSTTSTASTTTITSATSTTTTTTTTSTTAEPGVNTNILTAASGVIMSPKYPNNYPDDLNLSWTIQTTADKVIIVHFDDLAIEESNTCEYDYLRITDGNELFSGRLYCGFVLPPDFAALSTRVRVDFYTDGAVTARGFSMRWNTTNRCEEEQYACWNGVCIPTAQRCDGVDQCGDESDEIECVQAPIASDQCGKVDHAPEFTWDPRIVGGNAAANHSWPWQAAVYQYNVDFPLCGGAVISDLWVLTAAHCVHAYTIPGSLHVDVGKVSRIGGEDQVQQVSEIHAHPSYSTFNHSNDIALLKLVSPFVFNDKVRPICVSSSELAVADGEFLVATGFGRLSFQGPTVGVLYQARLPAVSNSQCAGIYNQLEPPVPIQASQICAGDVARGGVGTCQGDSGGPLVKLVGKNTWYLVGLTSFGVECARPGFPGVYARVSFFASWMEEIRSGLGVTAGASSETTTSGSSPRTRKYALVGFGVAFSISTTQLFQGAVF